MGHGALCWPLEKEEILLWQGRPAPRCYLFTRWLQALLGTLLFLVTSVWFWVAWQLWSEGSLNFYLLFGPLLMVVVSFALGPGWLLARRRRWEYIFYALSTTHLFMSSYHGIKKYPLADLQGFQRKVYGTHLASIRLNFTGYAPVVLECLEYPEHVVELIDRQTVRTDGNF
jgi:hypothetical protein